MKTVEDIKSLLESIWKQETSNLKPGEEGVIRITEGWSTADESDPNRHMVEAYEIGGRMPVLTGRGGMNNLLKGGYIPLKVYLNGQPMEVDDFIKQFKQLTHE